jgi:hypothetical protein
MGKALEDGLTASEALYGFVAWLTSADEATTFSSSERDAGNAAKLVVRFCEANFLRVPREDWIDGLIYPGEVEDDDETATD